MSPAGLKAIAEEAGLEIVIVCATASATSSAATRLNLGLQRRPEPRGFRGPRRRATC